jgi:ferredoxin
MIEAREGSRSMQVNVDRELCFRHARCFAHCPEVFGLDEEGYSVVLLPEIPEEYQERTREAARLCPEQAISLTE